MKLRKHFSQNKRGFTLVELLVTLAIEGLIACGIAAIIFQVFTVSKNNTDHMSAIKQVENAAQWLSKDGMMAQTLPTESMSYSGFPLSLAWADWDMATQSTTENTVLYTIETNGELKRTCNVRINGGTWSPTVSVIARYIVPDINKTHYRFQNGTFEFSIGARVTQGSSVVTETREYTVIPRSY